MTDSLLPFSVFFASIFTGNILLTNYLGMCSFLSVSKELKTSTGLGMAVIFVMATTTPLNWIVYQYLLIPFGLEYLRFIVFIIVIAAFVQLTEMTLERYSEPLYQSLGIFLPLITVNCAILGVSLFMVIREYTLLTSFFFGLGSGIGWFIAIIAMAGIRQKLKNAKIPPGLEGPGIALVIAGFMAMAFMGFSGMIALS
ncbi:NADH:ubiquinone reductase (Na(+)-transporting) subunit E [Sphaerochaeta halotolerans]|jgi:Na+-transporting NADH:ubiquinone oxidoreductase subunit E|uniref:NADH:ubiquinone reductase (Na(+)-transporting) subunit E n=1 Tax=Sphaerochaeta halotolerans TaxID=2293840 RepID=A0A372MLC5_9SPIR|nr:Rnf-Nqr domain containing protein [Sphaerochaeta halotolerans]MBG0767526.1 NADH:ubiquinone reductase (Na(+)-transporting) subunit E [Spirochaetaceae bacterium]MDK2860244.1 Na+-transporting NADH:ubiquinone oxidoreductase subunit [Sphaerochaeta sp.]MDN5334448.1 Na+-transporting NADH:ubiquinone oxidoreductase subunit [Sphaerochaeta sp.]MXI85432.1 NADH:ubiquinone reductase (Na(+)-transporting) subunit E [Sphaerochaeta halotolerans]RFU95980.1 NADH:ubiquinone reductase (Na(+)-transporting) subuni